MTLDKWSTSTHGVVPAVELELDLHEVPTYLHAFIQSEHEEFRPPYEPVRKNIREVIAQNAARPRVAAQRPSADIENSRLRTWKKEFEEFGFLYVDDDQRIRTTALGRIIRDLHADVASKIQGANDHIANLALSVLNRHVLRNPLVTADYPTNTDLHPYRAIWRTARANGDRIHWEELNRVLLRVLHEEDLPSAIASIQAARQSAHDPYTKQELEALGSPAVNEGSETRRRITPWLTRAGFGGTFLREDDNGFWRLTPSQLGLIDKILASPVAPPPADALQSQEAYIQYIISGLEVSKVQPSPNDLLLLEQARSAVERFGGQKVIVLSGLPSTGKTRLARMLAAQLTDNDPYRLEEIQFHETITYDRFVEGFVPREDGQGYELKSMTLRVVNNKALQDSNDRTYVLLIEEFTRADVHAVLGELLTYVEHRDRTFRLPLSQEDTRIASNLVVIATMNPRDRSALTLDDAILRRLHQIELKPSSSILESLLKDRLDGAIAKQLTDWYDLYASTLPFGHGEWANARSVEDLHDIWTGTLIYFLRDPTGNIKQQYAGAVAAFPWA